MVSGLENLFLGEANGVRTPPPEITISITGVSAGKDDVA